MAFGPTARYIGEHRQDRQFIIVVPKKERIMPEQKQAKCDDGQAGCNCTGDCKTRSSRFGHAAKFNAEHPTSNIQHPAQRMRGPMFDVERSMFSSYKTTGFPSVMTRTFSSMP